MTEAALGIPVSQSSVSAAVAQLEAAVGVQLLIRHHAQGVSPTPAGRRFLEHALELLSEAEQLERLAADLTEDVSGRLDLGCLVTIAPLVTPRLCHEFSARYPAVEIAVVEAGQDALLEGMRTGDPQPRRDLRPRARRGHLLRGAGDARALRGRGRRPSARAARGR